MKTQARDRWMRGGDSALEELRGAERRVHSQGGEDGVLERIFAGIGVTNRFFVEFGAKDGLQLSNTARLRLECGWRGALFDGDPAWQAPGIVCQWITADNVDDTFERHGVPQHFDLLSIDVDGNDYWIWRALSRHRARVVVIEYNIFFDLEPKTVPYDPHRVWDESCYHGASLAALEKLGRAKGYALVYTDQFAPNAFFVERALLPERFRDVPLHRAARWDGLGPAPDPLRRPWVDV